MRAALLAMLALAAVGACVDGSTLAAESADVRACDEPCATGSCEPSSRTLHIGAATFVADSGYGVMSQAGYLTVAGAAVAYAPIALPAGTLIEGVTVYYDVGAAGGAVRPGVRRMNPATGAITPVWIGATDGTGAAIESQSVALGAAPMLASDVYWVEALMTGASNRLYGAVVDYVEVQP